MHLVQVMFDDFDPRLLESPQLMVPVLLLPAAVLMLVRQVRLGEYYLPWRWVPLPSAHHILTAVLLGWCNRRLFQHWCSVSWIGGCCWQWVLLDSLLLYPAAVWYFSSVSPSTC